jgi:hypothetical protein
MVSCKWYNLDRKVFSTPPPPLLLPLFPASCTIPTSALHIHLLTSNSHFWNSRFSNSHFSLSFAATKHLWLGYPSGASQRYDDIQVSNDTYCLKQPATNTKDWAYLNTSPNPPVARIISFLHSSQFPLSTSANDSQVTRPVRIARIVLAVAVTASQRKTSIRKSASGVL